MNLPEQTMRHADQVAFLVTLAHSEWLESEQAGMEEYNFDEYLPFLTWAAARMRDGTE